eukprot:SAG31_NODE_668_length_12945_cov_15.915849_9_plen_95_part_00
MHGNATSPYVEVACVDDSECFVAAKTTIFVAIVFSNVLVASLLFLMGSGHTAQVRLGALPASAHRCAFVTCHSLVMSLHRSPTRWSASSRLRCR